MALKRVFYLSGGQLVAHHWKGGRFVEQFVFAGDEQGLSQFSRYLESSDLDPVSLLVDVVEEEFREETVPHVLGGDRKSLLNTRKSRLFRDATYTYANVQGREADGRRDDRVLFSSLIRPDLLAPWLGHIARLKVPLTGIYSLPLLSELLLKPLNLNSSHALLVSLHSPGGLRQSFFHEKQLKLSRLAVTPDMDGARYPSYILSEVEKLRRYLGSLRQLARDTPLDVFIISEGQKLSDLKRQSTDSVTTRHHFVDTSELAAKVGLKSATQAFSADMIFAHLLAKHGPRNHYAPVRETRYFSLKRARSAMLAASILLFLGTLGWSAYTFIKFVGAKQDTLRVNRETTFYTKLLSDARHSLPPAPALAHDIKMAVEMEARLRAYRALPFRMMTTLSASLEGFPTLHLDEIDWLSTPDANASLKAGSSARGVSRIESLAVTSGLTPEEVGEQYHIAHIGGHLAPFDGDYRTALSTINRFAELLSRNQNVERVDTLALPFNASSQQRLLGSAGAAVQSGDANFRLRIVMKALEAPEGAS